MGRFLEDNGSHLSPEQHGLLNFDELSALWCLGLALWYGHAVAKNYRRTNDVSSQQAQNNNDGSFHVIHWFIFSIAVMGLANFLFSFSLLEVLDHRTSIGSTVRNLSYGNMVLACFRHPCTLCLGVLAPKVSFGDGNNVIQRRWGITDERGARGIRITTMRLAAVAGAEVLLRLTENLMMLFQYDRRDPATVRIVDVFEYTMDGIFLAWMIYSLYEATIRTIGLDYGRGYAWSKSSLLKHYWILYAIFVSISLIEGLVGTLHFVTHIFPISEHLKYTFYKVHGLNDLLLLTGIAFFVRPKIQDTTSSTLQENELTAGLASDDDYTLLLDDGTGGQDPDSGEDGLLTSGLEMTTNLAPQAETALS